MIIIVIITTVVGLIIKTMQTILGSKTMQHEGRLYEFFLVFIFARPMFLCTKLFQIFPMRPDTLTGRCRSV
jgi:type III secretory pathway component EscS